MLVEVILGVIVLTGIVLTLSLLILVIRSRLVCTGNVTIAINEGRVISVPAGSNLLRSLASAQIYIASACGGRGTCGQCKVTVLEGGGPILPTERALITRREAANRFRLACQVAVRQEMRILVPEEVFGVRKWKCQVRSNRNVATFIKELVLELPHGEVMDFRAGSYVLVECPPYQTTFDKFDIAPEFRSDWDRHNLWRYEAGTKETTVRAYSLANYPAEREVVTLNVRIALPPPGSGKRVPPGIASSYLFSLKPGDRVVLSGSYGHFFARENNREMVFLGGGVGMAPMRSHILDQVKRLKTHRKITFWYGARSQKELFYVELFDRLARTHDNFQWFVALSEPKAEDPWTGYTGFLHQVAYDNYLRDHPAPEYCEYYVCGPPLMNKAVIKMLDDLGVDPEDIMLDDFGG
jgi:Na+-transporting NADH:ubiquinone oxidoreductase subunit F